MPCHVLYFGSLTLFSHFEGTSTLEIALGDIFGTCVHIYLSQCLECFKEDDYALMTSHLSF
jgi:hypothetical protein